MDYLNGTIDEKCLPNKVRPSLIHCSFQVTLTATWNHRSTSPWTKRTWKCGTGSRSRSKVMRTLCAPFRRWINGSRSSKRSTANSMSSKWDQKVENLTTRSFFQIQHFFQVFERLRDFQSEIPSELEDEIKSHSTEDQEGERPTHFES